MVKIGLKLWSTNDFYIKNAKQLYDQKIIDYIELFIVPDSFKAFITKWQECRIPYIFHAPHSCQGFNFAGPTSEPGNEKLLLQVEKFRNVLLPRFIIFHSGSNGSIEETIRQITFYKSKFSDIFSIAVIENKPAIGLKGERLIGAYPEEMTRIVKECSLGFCLDIGHAIFAAAFHKTDYKEFLFELFSLAPNILHLSDGHVNNIKDEHLHLGSGDFNFTLIRQFLSRFQVPYLTIETGKDSKENLDDFEKDVLFLRTMLS